MYLVGAPHPNKDVARRLLTNAVRDVERLVTSAEVYQEVLHRYVAIDRRDAIGPAFDVLDGLTDEVFAITERDLRRAREILEADRFHSARDALHLAVMETNGVERILSFDKAFDYWPGVARIRD